MKFVILTLVMVFTVVASATITTTTQSGDWDASSTWDNGVPGCYDTIVISTGHRVTLIQDESLSSCGSPVYVIVDGTLVLGSGFWFLSTSYTLTLPAGSALSIGVDGIIAGGTWTAATIIAGTTTIYNNTSDGNPSGPDYIAETGTTLPVELLSFASEAKNNSVIIYWQTVSEKNSANFEVEHSIDAVSWNSIGMVEGSGNSNLLLNYTFVDEAPIHGPNYYRLKQIDFDGAYEYFGPIYQNFRNANAKGELKIYPNPNGQGNLNVSIGIPMEQGDVIEIYDYSGRLIKQIQLPESSIRYDIDVSNFTKGIYFVRFMNQNSQLTEKLIIQ